MKKSSRYLLIGLGIAVFLILAPLLILYVSGNRLNLDGRETRGTGILDVKSEPSGASVQVDDQSKNSTPAIVRFLNQGEYQVKITQEGFFDWTKRLPIEAGKVTYAQEGVNQVQLIKKPEPITIAPANVSSFALVGNTIWFTNGNSIVSAPVNEPSNQTIVPLTFSPKSITILRDKHHLYLENNTILNTDDNSIIVVPFPPFDNLTKASGITVAPNNIVVFQHDNSLMSYDPGSGKVTTLLKGVSAFALLGTTGYLVEDMANNMGHSVIKAAVWNGSTFTDFQTLIADAFLQDNRGSLFITDNKELFCQCGYLYRIGQNLELVSNDVQTTNLDLATNELTFQNSSELWFYNFRTSKPQLLTRGFVGPSTSFLLRSSIGYGFIGNSLGLKTVEIDSRDQQNSYQLLNGGQVHQLAVTENQKAVLALQNGSLILVEIRN